MKFSQPLWLVVGSLVVLALAAWWWLSARRAQTALRTAFNTPLLAHLLRSVNWPRRRGKQLLFAAGVLALGLALARPQWGRNEIELERTGGTW